MYYPYRYLPEEIQGQDVVLCAVVGEVDYANVKGQVLELLNGDTYEIVKIDRIFQDGVAFIVKPL